jgi:hypothetical protein
MKNLLVALFVFVAFSAFSFATVNDNLLTGKTGTGSFICSVLTPLAVDSPLQVNLGEFVVSTTEYPLTDAITFTVTGQNSHVYFFKTTATPANTNATFAGGWDLDGTGATTKTLSATGSQTHVYTLTGLTANASGSATLDLSVTVAYNTF